MKRIIYSKTLVDSEVPDYIVVLAAPKTDPSAEYIRRQHQDHRTYKWSGAVSEWSETTPEDDPRWRAEFDEKTWRAR